MFETENIEFKATLTDDIYKEVIAFINTEGGTIYVGIDDHGQAVGLKNIDDTYTRITNGIRDAIAPDATMFIKYTLQDNQIICISIQEGSSKPYYLKSKGLKPNGVYTRQGASSVPASPDQIRQMIKTSDGDIFETMRSIEQQLTFNDAQEAFQKYQVDFSEDKYIALGIRNSIDDQYTNLAWILSDQATHTTKVAVFGDDTNTVFKDHREFSGSIFKQLDEVFAYLTFCNRTTWTFQGVERIEHSDYPPEALREALLNALVHRDYSYSGSIIINVNEHFTEFISIGGLLPGLSEADIRSGISQPRNRNLAAIFHRLRLIESYGTGIRRIYNLYKNCSAQPQIVVTPNTFKLILPNMNAQTDTSAPTQIVSQPLTPQMETLLKYLEDYGELTDEDVMELLNVKKTRAYVITKQLCDRGYIVAEGRGPEKKYLLVK